MLSKSLILLVAALCVVGAAPPTPALLNRTVRYDGQMVVQVARTPQVLKAAERLELDIWGKSTKTLDIRVTQAQYRELVRTIPHNTQVKVINRNIQAAVDAETAQLSKQLSKPQVIAVGPEWHTAYHTFDDIVGWMKEVANKYGKLAKFDASIGKSVEGRDIPMLRITGSSTSTKPKKSVYVQSLQHAREWISGAATQYLVDTLASGYGSNSRITAVLDQVELLIVPVCNPDGYTYTWSRDRYWRKNRTKNSDGTFGVDPNRNWPDHWGTGGSSKSPSAENYMGPSAASEPEVKAMMKAYSSGSDMIAAVDIHSFSQLILRPYGWTENRAPDEAALTKIGEVMKAEIAKPKGTSYTNQRVVDLYVASGGSNDWWYGLGTPKGTQKPYAMALELNPAFAFGASGFVLDPKNIVPVGTEITNAILGMTEYALANPLGPQL
jgi:murein tripeptide amidase MpaA